MPAMATPSNFRPCLMGRYPARPPRRRGGTKAVDHHIVAVLVLAQRLEVDLDLRADGEVVGAAKKDGLHPRPLGQVDLGHAVAGDVDVLLAEHRDVAVGPGVDRPLRRQLDVLGALVQAPGAHQPAGKERLAAVRATAPEQPRRFGRVVGDPEEPWLNGDSGHALLASRYLAAAAPPGVALAIGDGAPVPGESGTDAVLAARGAGGSSGSIAGTRQPRISVDLSQDALRFGRWIPSIGAFNQERAGRSALRIGPRPGCWVPHTGGPLSLSLASAHTPNNEGNRHAEGHGQSGHTTGVRHRGHPSRQELQLEPRSVAQVPFGEGHRACSAPQPVRCRDHPRACSAPQSVRCADYHRGCSVAR